MIKDNHLLILQIKPAACILLQQEVARGADTHALEHPNG